MRWGERTGSHVDAHEEMAEVLQFEALRDCLCENPGGAAGRTSALGTS